MNLSITASDANGHGNGAARYYIAQHLRDVFRREPRNIGVFVLKGSAVAARFLGERDPGDIDRRSLKSFPNPSVYRLWIDHWRRLMRTVNGDIESCLLVSGEANYFVIPGGEVTGTGEDSAEQICSYLYHLLVPPEGGLASALGQAEPDEDVQELRTEIVTSFKDLGIMQAGSNPWVRNPIRAGWHVPGHGGRWYEASLYQEWSGGKSIMEPINFATPRKLNAMHRAGFVAAMFREVGHELADANGLVFDPIAIVRLRDDDTDNKNVELGLGLLRETGRVINWLDDNERALFIDERLSRAAAAELTLRRHRLRRAASVLGAQRSYNPPDGAA